MNDVQKIADSGRRIREILDQVKSPDYEGGPYRLVHTDIHGTPNYYAGGAYMSELTVRELLHVFSDNPHKHHQTYSVEPPLPEQSESFDIASP